VSLEGVSTIVENPVEKWHVIVDILVGAGEFKA
jgi:hypothetical protein